MSAFVGVEFAELKSDNMGMARKASAFFKKPHSRLPEFFLISKTALTYLVAKLNPFQLFDQSIES